VVYQSKLFDGGYRRCIVDIPSVYRRYTVDIVGVPSSTVGIPLVTVEYRRYTPSYCRLPPLYIRLPLVTALIPWITPEYRPYTLGNC